MLYYSTNDSATGVSLREAVIRGLAPDGGLYMPQTIPKMASGFVGGHEKRSLQEIAFEVANQFTYAELSASELHRIVESAITFDAPLVSMTPRIHTLELFHGPTLAFKDFGARFMARLLSHFVRNDNKEHVVLVATSGDTGTAVAQGFLGAEGIRVIILYPSGKVSPAQEAQLTTCGENIQAVEVAGTFDDCQRMVKRAFQDQDLQQTVRLTSANSINIARLIPQAFYYFSGFQDMPAALQDTVYVSVPSGNFGNLTAGLIAKRMGLPVSKFIAATNANDVVPVYFRTGRFTPKASVKTISNAMDVGNPSNFARMLALYDNNLEALRRDVQSFSFSDTETASAIKKVHDAHSYLMDPHGAVGFLGLKKGLPAHATGFFLECAHPGKFNEVVEDVIGEPVELPAELREALQKQKQAFRIASSYEEFREKLVQIMR